MADLSRDDLRAAVAAGVLSEVQAAALIALAESRAGQRAIEDEPFELFRGFSEIFVSVGLVLLISGMAGASGLFVPPVAVGVIGVVLSAVLARYFTLKRRMVLPSVVLVSGFAMAMAGLAGAVIAMMSDGIPPARSMAVVAGLVTGAGLVWWYRVFRVPFTMFLLGLTGLGVTFSLTAGTGHVSLASNWNRIRDVFDISSGSGLALGTLIFGLIAFAVAMWFDTSDPHRLGRRAASGFWLHVLAAPALVNTVALSFYNRQDTTGYIMLALALAAITVLALIIDRRSFLTAGLGYLAVLVSLAFRSADGGIGWVLTTLVLGIFITFIGARWTDLRAALMRALPDFPGKDRLPPYAETI